MARVSGGQTSEEKERNRKNAEVAIETKNTTKVGNRLIWISIFVALIIAGVSLYFTTIKPRIGRKECSKIAEEKAKKTRTSVSVFDLPSPEEMREVYREEYNFQYNKCLRDKGL
jgi:cell division protein FtsL